MIEILSPASATRVLARLLGESERGIRAIVFASLALATAALLAWLAVWAGVSPLPQGNPGSAQVLHAMVGFFGLLAMLPSAGLMAFERWTQSASGRALKAARAGTSLAT